MKRKRRLSKLILRLLIAGNIVMIIIESLFTAFVLYVIWEVIRKIFFTGT